MKTAGSSDLKLLAPLLQADALNWGQHGSTSLAAPMIARDD
jgi:hypothetical protein